MQFLPQDQLQAFLAHLAGRAHGRGAGGRAGRRALPPLGARASRSSWTCCWPSSRPKEFVFRQTETYLKYGYVMEGPAASRRPCPTPPTARRPPSRRPTQGAGGGQGPRGGDRRPAERGARPGDLRPAPVRRPGLRPDGPGLRRLRRLLLRPALQRPARGHHAAGGHLRDPRSTCFCTAIGGCPAGHEGVDALFTQVDGGFTVEALTAQGRGGAGPRPALALADATDAQTDAAAEVKMAATGKVDVPFDLDGVRDNLHDNIADDRLARPGHALHQLRHLHLRVPQLLLLQHQRLAWWRARATASAAGTTASTRSYTEETSGHNPRAHKSNRFRNRFSHKFWYYPDKYDSLLCSGCGRCIMHCPTRIDIREVLRDGSPAGQPPAEPVAAPAAECGDAAASVRGARGARRRRASPTEARRHRCLTTARQRLTFADVVPGAQHRARRQAGAATRTCPRSRRSSRSSRRRPTSRPSACASTTPRCMENFSFMPGQVGQFGRVRRGRVHLRHHLQAVREGRTSSSR